MGHRSNLIAIAVLVGAMMAWVGVMAIGVSTSVSLLSGGASIIGLIGAHKYVRRVDEQKALEVAHHTAALEVARFDPRARLAVELLQNDMAAYLMWCSPGIMIGYPIDRQTGYMGAWPSLLPGQDPGHAPDNGIRPSPAGARVRLIMPTGFSREDVAANLGKLAVALDVPEVQIIEADGAVIVLELRVRNPLADTVMLPVPEPSPVPLKALRVGMREDGEYHRLQVWNIHLFLAGLTGSGKSGVLWSIIAALAPDIHAGRVQLHMIDLKLGTEMAAGYRLYASWAWKVADAIEILEKLVREIMYTRAHPRRESAMRTGIPLRNHEPTPGDPHHVLMIDEVIALIKLVGDRKADFDVPQIDGTWKKENIRVDKYVGILLLELLSQARSFGITVIVSTQNAAKEIFEALRDMFPIMIGLRQASEQQVQMVYGTGAAERGISIKGIPFDKQGTAYIDSPEAGGMASRVRFFRVSDEQITALVNAYGRPLELEAAPAASEMPIVLDAPIAEPIPATAPAAQEAEQARVIQMPAAAHQPGEGSKPTTLWCGNEACTEGPDGGRAQVEQTPGRKAKLYCCPACRVAAHRARQRSS
jgi:hypothetical protein